MELIEVRRALLRSMDARRAGVRHCPRDFASAESKTTAGGIAPAFVEGEYRRRIMTIERAISSTVYTQLVTTTSILAKLAVCSILLAGISSAHAVSDDGANRSGVSRRSGVPAAPRLAAFLKANC